MTATLPDSLLRSATRIGLRDLLGLYEGGFRLSIRAWDFVCQEALQIGDAEPLHVTRDQYEAHLRTEIERLDFLLREIDPRADARSEEYRARFTALRDQYATQYNALFPRWRTRDDLEGILLERITPNNERLNELAKRYPPPRAWYDETENPIAAEVGVTICIEW